jgi:hypothetical protein
MDWIVALGKVLESDDPNTTSYTGFNGQVRDVKDLNKYPSDYTPIEVLNTAGVPKFMPETCFPQLLGGTPSTEI